MCGTVLAVWKYKVQTSMELTIKWEEEANIQANKICSVNLVVVCAMKKIKAEHEGKVAG